jgi:hypothetical protein
MNLHEFIQKEIRTTLNGRINEGRPIPMDTPNTFIYPEFKMYASKNKKMFKKELEKSKGDSSKMSLTLSALWYKWARQNHKEFTHIKDNKKFGRALMVMMVKDDVIFSIDAFKKTNNITKLKEDIVDQAFLDAKPVEDEDESVEEAAKRDYKKEYEKYGKSEKAKKYRAELNKYNRDKGTYGNGDGKDASHKGGKIVGFEDESKNRGRAEKSRLKKEATFVPNSGTMSGGVLRLDNRKYQLKKDIKNVKIGNYIVTLPKGTILYNIAGGLFADHKSLEQYADRNRQYFKKPTFKGIQITQKTDTIKDIDKNSKVLESVNEVKDNLYLQLHKKYAEQIKGLKANKIKKLSDLVWVQRRSMSDRDDYFDMDSKKKKELSAEYRIERNLLKKYMARDYSVMLPKGTEKLPESVNEANDTYFKTAGEAVDFAKTKAEKKGYEIDEDDWNNQITHGGRYSRLRPSVGKTHTFQIGLLKKGKPQRKGLSISLFGMDSGNYELTYYIN